MKPYVRAVYVIVAVFTAVLLFDSVSNGRTDDIFMCFIVITLLLIPAAVKRAFSADLPPALEISVLLLIFFADVCGDMFDMYVNIAAWDIFLHLISGFMFAGVGLALKEFFERRAKTNFSVSPAFLVFFAFCFSLVIEMFWEVIEFGSDMIFATDMQKDNVVSRISSVLLNPMHENSPVIINGIKETAVNGKGISVSGYLDIGIIDTMKDMIMNTIGAFVFCVFGYFYLKHGKFRFVSGFIPRFFCGNASPQ